MDLSHTTKYKQVTIYDWPWSQTCMDCAHGEFFQSDTFDSSNMLCHIACEDNDGSVCNGFKKKTDDEEEEED